MLPVDAGVYLRGRRVINTIAACLAGVNAISTGLMAGSTLNCPETGGAGTTNAMVVALQLVVLCGEDIHGEVDPTSRTTQP